MTRPGLKSGWTLNNIDALNDILFQELEKLGAACELEELGDQTLPDGSKLQLPPILLGTLGTDPKKKTLLVYGHLDVQPAEKVYYCFDNNLIGVIKS